MKDLAYIRDIPWSEIWNTWKTTEEESWKEYYQSKGYKTWSSWRQVYLDVIKPEERQWKLYKIEDPLMSVPEVFVGPFRGWKKYYTDREHSRYKDIAKSDLISENEKVMRLSKEYPEKVLFVGLRYKDKTMFIEGTHRAVALSIISEDVRDVDVNAFVALTTFSDQEAELFHNIFTQIRPSSES